MAAQGRLTPANTQRVLAVIADFTEKLNILGPLGGSRCPERFREKLTTAIPETVSKILEHVSSSSVPMANVSGQTQQQLEESVAIAGAAWNVQEIIEEFSKETRISTEVLQGGTDNSTATSATLKAEARRTLLFCLLGRVVEELRGGNGSFRALNAFVESEKAARRISQILSARKDRITAETKKILEESRAEEAEAKSEASKQESEIAELRTRLAELRASSAIDSKVLVKELHARADTQKRVIRERDQAMAKELADLRRKIEAEDQVNAMMTAHLEGRLGKLQGQVNEWMNRFEQDTEAATHTLEGLKTKKERDLVQLYDSRERSRDVSEEIAKHKKAAEIQRDIAELERKQAAAALIIQTRWRGFRTRQEFEAMKKKLAAKSKKKAGGKKGVSLPKLKK